MKTTVLVLSLFIANTIAFGQETISVTIEVQGMLNRKGAMSISVFNNPESFMQSPVKNIKIKLDEHDGESFTLTDLPKGEYAIVVLHDENENGQLDFGGMGPVEGYGFSNNPDAMFGPASYAQSKIILEEDTNLMIKLN